MESLHLLQDQLRPVIDDSKNKYITQEWHKNVYRERKGQNPPGFD